MKKLLAAAISAVAITTSFIAHADVTPQAKQSMVQSEKAKGVWIDVRSAEEFNAGHLQNAVNIPHDKIIEGVKALGSDKDAPINLYCRSGRRAEAALTELKNAGYTNVINHGGYEDLVKKGLK
ncbi:rhodanese-like domain-containing protein [uncultured Haemophilus sp.]|uniref:rhodanese-like domain-containing protein n=1 Tax=uncultured Haemophilus sp. TaxID=237779 RepID=UPI0025E3BD11|nr:rhodanese-like domain-containing protein [uncultured Haemophilus sp.]MBS5085397.1 rhodanese-like domain-containing protein [Haemophilus parainfluenzae]MBS7202620.1 rhodanese-like domain-containing protein [Haemophilus parainfluenzae]MDU1944717.1 rhodanese-like domain-containing protein [Haemophilus parainfluenzae]MDU2038368.1 rhodanese-like domain-containing protein [Haemophilus parainfluenzae]MDU6288449.1 rhodanese-like domain-containing protein [Haemophilus parainfluenzae]